MLSVLRTVKRVPRVIRTAINWVNALDYASKSEYEAALRTLEKVDTFDTRFSIEVDLLKAVLLNHLGREEESFRLCGDLLVRIDQAEWISNANKAYLLSFTAWIANRSIDQIGDSYRDLHGFWDLKLENVTLEAVSSHHKMNFPLRCHPDWVE